jgi:catechol 2,3-dioxygenase-like lactoylglutathione lyase family enzyme
LVVTGLRQVSQRVVDLDRAVAFYRDVLDLPLVARFGQLAFFDLGGVRLFMEGSGTDPAEGSAVLYLAVDDVRATRAGLEDRGVAFADDVHLIHRDDAGTFGPPAEEWMTFFRDSEGNLLALSARVPLGETSAAQTSM